MQKELWKPVPGFESTHSVSNLGRIMSLCPRCSAKPVHSHRTGKEPYVMNTYPNRKGYLAIRIGTSAADRKHWAVHRLVAIVFVPNPFDKPQVNHIDGNKQNNHHTNLEWVTNQENCIHTYKNGFSTKAVGERSPKAKLSNQDIINIRNDQRNPGIIASEYMVSRGHINSIKAGRLRTRDT